MRQKIFQPLEVTTAPAGMSNVQGKRKTEKNRTVIPKDVMLEIKEYCEKNNRHFLLACYIEYYCFIRPKEMSYIRIRDISVMHGTIAISAEVSKNRVANESIRHHESYF